MKSLIPRPCPVLGGVVVLCYGVLISVFLSSCALLERGTRAKPEPVATTQRVALKAGFQWGPISPEQATNQFPYALAFDPETETLFFTDIINNLICVRRSDGTAGVLTESPNLGLSMPLALAYAAPMTLVIADTGNKRVCALTPEGIAEQLVASNGRVTGLALVPGGALYYSDFDACTVVRATADGTQTIVAGVGSPGYSGDGGNGVNAALNGPYGLAWFDNRLFIADSLNHRIRVLDLTAGRIDTFAGNGTRGTWIPASPVNGLEVALNEPRGVTVDQSGNVYVLNTFGRSILCFDQNGQFLPQKLRADLGGSARPACGFVIDGNLAYTDLVSPGIRELPLGPDIPFDRVQNATGSQELTSDQLETTPPPAETEPECEPPPPAGPDVTTCRLVGPRHVIDEASMQYTLALDLAPKVQIGGVVAEVRFDARHLKCASVAAVQGVSPETVQTHCSQARGRVRVTMHTRAGTPPLSGSVQLCDLLFEARWDSRVPTVAEVVVPTPTVIAPDGTGVPARGENFSITNFLYGDLSGDRKTDLVDALYLLRNKEAVLEESQVLVGDVDLDGMVTISDALSIIRAIPGDGLRLPTIPPREKADWSADDAAFQDALAGKMSQGEIHDLTNRPEKEREESQAAWAEKLLEAGAVLFVQVPDCAAPDERELLVDLMLGLPAGKRLGAFEVAVKLDSERVALEEALIHDRGPEGIVGTAEVTSSGASLRGVCRYPGEATAATVKLASLLLNLNPPGGVTDWETTLHPVAGELIDHQGGAMFGFGAPTTIRSYRLGDPTRDGKVDAVDLLLLLESLIGKKDMTRLRSPKAADLDRDGRHTIRDAVLLDRLANGEALLDVTTSSGRQVAAEYVTRRLLFGQEEDCLLPRMIERIEAESELAETVDDVLKTHNIVRLDAPATVPQQGHFLATLVCDLQPQMSLAGYQVEIECDPNALAIETVVPPAAMETSSHPVVYHISQSGSRLSLSQIPNVGAGAELRQLLLASVLFQMKTGTGAPPASTVIRLRNQGVVDGHARPLETICLDQTVGNFLPGDVDGNGVVDRADEELLTQVVVGEAEDEALANPAAADLDLDGSIDVVDVVLIGQAILGEAGQQVINRARQRAAIARKIARPYQ